MTDNNNNEENRSNNQPKKIKWLRNSWKRYWRHQSDWVDKTKGNLMVAATVIATMSFQVMVNPPGGFWQEDKRCPLRGQSGFKKDCVSKIAGTSILSYESSRKHYMAMVVSCTVSFSASMSLILLVILGLRLRNRLVMAILVFFMAVAVLGMVSSFFCAVILVHLLDWDLVINFLCYLAFWVLFPCGIVLFKLIMGLVWIIRKICCGRRSSTQLPTQLPTTQPVQDHSQV